MRNTSKESLQRSQMDEDDTFRILRRTPFEDLLTHLDNMPRTAPLYMLGGTAFESKKHELVRHYEKLKCLERHGWSFDEFVLESEKRNIMSAVDQYNSDNSFPVDLVNRAKEFFPNAKFTQAKIELE